VAPFKTAASRQELQIELAFSIIQANSRAGIKTAIGDATSPSIIASARNIEKQMDVFSREYVRQSRRLIDRLAEEGDRCGKTLIDSLVHL
jgi:hypothetical protein